MHFTFRPNTPNSPASDMDFTDMNLWGIIAMPVGLILCFAPAVVVWWLVDSRRDARHSGGHSRH
jgi:predicted cation transporter